jgi:MEMO1 family protein
MRLRWMISCLALTSACGGDFVQPGADDPTARQWEKAGSWYPDDPDDLDDDVEDLLAGVDAGSPRPALAILTPHAGLKSSGPTAAEIFARTEIPDSIILLAPDHWGDGAHTAVWTEGPWLVPGHAIAVDQDLVAELEEALPDLESDRVAFQNHEEEMQLPFLQSLAPDTSLAAIAIFDNSRNHFADFDVARIEEWGEALAGILSAHADAGERVLLLTTTDLSHHQTLAVAEEQDPALLDFVEALDVEGLYDHVTGEEITICGEIPTAIMMAALRVLGRDSMEIVALGNNYHHSGDPDDVVGYPAAAAWE